MNVLVEGIGSMVFNTQLKYYREMNWNIFGIDIDDNSAGWHQVDQAYLVPRYSDALCFEVIEEIIRKNKVNIVFPTVNEGLLAWSKKIKEYKEKYNVYIMLSNEKVIRICTDKWQTYKFFYDNSIPTPRTSLERKYELLKPRVGRGSAGIMHTKKVSRSFKMDGYISQEVVHGEEYTIDILCDLDSNPIYIIPRKRVEVESGVSTKGITINDEQIIRYCKEIIEKLKPIGIINIQCIKAGNKVCFIEINPRIAGGSSLSFAASDNWFKAIECFYTNKKYRPRDVSFNCSMFRYYEDLILRGPTLSYTI